MWECGPISVALFKLTLHIICRYKLSMLTYVSMACLLLLVLIRNGIGILGTRHFTRKLVNDRLNI